MKEIVFVTSNKGKIESAQRDLIDVKVISYPFDLIEPRSDDIQEIAKYKVVQAYEKVGKPCIAMDSGFFIEALNGFPRANVNFGLETIGIDDMLYLMKIKTNKNCEFRECLAYYDGNEINYFHGTLKGTLAEERRGKPDKSNWSELCYVFEVPEINKTIAEMTQDERKEYCGNETASCFNPFSEWFNKKM
ncbi:MAG TPA: hypothetical protein DEP72_07910 [Clostridiales bacterium]|nr:MAG: hypothetical protein A2Y18_06645 [Clostridiales bacterium GWD2_32_19]HCC08061.1 hypothetical protein [Clostridiales bacterium]